MSEDEIFVFRILIVYTNGCLCHLTLMTRNLNFYIDEYDIYCKKNKIKNTRLKRAFMFAVLNITWPLDIILSIYFEYFYNGGDNNE